MKKQPIIPFLISNVYICVIMNNSDSIKHPSVTPEEAVKEARHVTWVGFWCNAALGTAKVIAGIVGRSGALVADGIHSFSDFITDVIVLVMVGIARRRPNARYQYGHGKYETFATMLIAVALIIVGIGIFIDGIKHVILALRGQELARPGWIALAICFASIVVKEWLFRYTRRVGVRIQSGAVIANAWHHRSDAFSSVATLVGVAGAMFLGENGRILDPIAAMIVAVFIIIVGIKMAIPAINELLEVSLPEKMEDQIRHIIAESEGVRTYHHLRTRRNGSKIIIEVHLKVNPDITVEQGHSIATEVENKLKNDFGNDSTIITTHIEPYRGEELLRDGSCGA